MDNAQPSLPDSLGWNCFQLGLFFLPSSAFVAALFLLFALCRTRFRGPLPYLRDPWNYPLLVAGCLMLVGCFFSYSGWLAWVGLANWLPFFWFFWSFQTYLLTAEERKRAAFCFVSGTIPVLITGFGQLWLGWEGPWHLFNGLIVWFVDLGGQPEGRLSGLFDYANVAGSWLAIVWPFALASLLQPSLNRFSRSFVLLISIGIVAALILTDSRNAWAGLILAIPFVLGAAQWNWLIPLMTLFLIPVGLAVLPNIAVEIQQWARGVVPESIWSRLNDMRFADVRPLEATRLNQWQVAIQLIAERPLIGWGAAAFSLLYPLRTGLWHGHAHNLPLELAVSHGFIVALLIVGTVVGLLFITLANGLLHGGGSKTGNYFFSTIFDRAWWAASFTLLFLHGSDMPFFDSRLNIAGWILLAGLRCMRLSADPIKVPF